MTKKLLHEAALERPLLGDGAMGTQLMIAGLEQGNCGEAWNLTHPERVLAIQRRYAEAGSDCIITNTFGGSRIMLTRHGKPNQVVEINKAARDTGTTVLTEQPDGFLASRKRSAATVSVVASSPVFGSKDELTTVGTWIWGF